jgi:hypothetical protein
VNASIISNLTVAQQRIWRDLGDYSTKLVERLLQSLQQKEAAYDAPQSRTLQRQASSKDEAGHALSHHHMYEADSRHWAKHLTGAKGPLFMVNNITYILLHFGEENPFDSATQTAPQNTSSTLISPTAMRRGQPDRERPRASLSSQVFPHRPEAPANTVSAQLGVDPALLAELRAKAIQKLERVCDQLGHPLLEQVAEVSSSLHYDKTGKNLTLDSGRILKARFGAFNAIMDELCAFQVR